MATEKLDNNTSDGAVLGQASTTKIAFHGGTPLAQQTLTAVATASASTTVRLRLQQLQAALVATGLFTE